MTIKRQSFCSHYLFWMKIFCISNLSNYLQAIVSFLIERKLIKIVTSCMEYKVKYMLHCYKLSLMKYSFLPITETFKEASLFKIHKILKFLYQCSLVLLTQIIRKLYFPNEFITWIFFLIFWATFCAIQWTLILIHLG